MTLFASIALTLTSLSFAAGIETRVSELYEMNKVNGKPKFIQTTKNTFQTDTDYTSESSIRSAEGTLVMKERAEIKNGKVQTQVMEQLQINERYELKVDGNKAHFKVFKLEPGKAEKLTDEGTADIDESFITGPLTEPYIKTRIPKLESGETVTADFGVFEYVRTVGFNFKKTKNSTDETLAIEMKPSSMWLKVLVDPIYFELNKKTGRLLKYRGRTPLREFVKNKWVPFDADIVYLTTETAKP